ncbi:hypothetical protein M2475_001728 [Breznakia sp. PF5-3]|uniref:zinc-dependent peptidase n=1 Tax=unclassified Breznakia TaxID=2623764 RepID=UPI002405B1F4|nr:MULTISPECIES: zinc-dependent peptidase [unclassified Breznakia]MDF9825258.1 hypothetical protein [Breznakia sp. PM6-1]MDF9836152.1 hypothetical protein [Breznakia sp. PF5-3]
MKNKRLILISIASGVVAFCFFLFIRIGTSQNVLFDSLIWNSDFLILGSMSAIVSICVYILGYRAPKPDIDEAGNLFEVKKERQLNFQIFLTKLITIAIIISTLFYVSSLLPFQDNRYAGNAVDIIDNDKIASDDSIIWKDGIPPIKVVGDIDSSEQSFIIKECIEKQPAILLEHTELIYLCSHEEFIKLRDKFYIGEAVAFATSLNNYIYIDTSVNGTFRVITHELAHNYDFKNGYLSSQDEFKEAFEEMSKAKEFNHLGYILNVEYAKTEPAEFFAEVSDAYFNKGDRLKELYPELYAYIDGIYKE